MQVGRVFLHGNLPAQVQLAQHPTFCQRLNSGKIVRKMTMCQKYIMVFSETKSSTCSPTSTRALLVLVAGDHDGEYEAVITSVG